MRQITTRIRPSASEPRSGDDEYQRQSVLHRIVLLNAFWLSLFLVVLVVAFSLSAHGRFLSAFNLRTIAGNASMFIILAVGEAFVIITAGIDLSVGGILVFSTIVVSELLARTGGANSSPIATLGCCLAGIAAGAAWGALNGVLVVRARVSPLIVTLASSGASLGLAEVITNGQDLSNVPNALTNGLGNGQLFHQIPWSTIVAVLVAVLGAAALHHTLFGRRTLAIGSNAAAARRAGIKVGRHLILVYALSGTCAGLAGVVSLAQFAATTETGHAGDALAAIAAVVLGGTSLFGGSGRMFGAVIGTLIPAVLADGFVLIGLQPFWQSVAVGVVLVLAVRLDRSQRAAVGAVGDD